MIHNMIFGGNGSGTDLNFSIVSYSSVEDLPATADENTIAVITTTEIASWYFSATQPENASLGDVWLTTVSTSDITFNALKQNNITVYPVSAKQYIGNEWISVEAYIYQANAWVQFIPVVYLIENGYIDLEAHPYSYIYYHYSGTKNGTDPTNRVENLRTYDGKTALWITGANGSKYTHSFGNVTVPQSATKFIIEYYRLCSYNADPIFAIGGAQITISRGDAKYLTNGTAEIDVRALQGQTVPFVFSNTGNSGNEDNYIGNAWFE